MKKITPLIIVFLCFVCSVCVDAASLPTDVETLKVLLVGNSYAENCAAYVNRLMSNTEVDAQRYCVYVAYRGQGTLQYWAEQLENEKTFKLNRRAGNIAMNDSPESLRELLSQDWDIVSFQQYSGDCIDASTYSPYLRQLIDATHDCCTNPRVSIVCLMPWRYGAYYDATPSGDERYKAICEATKTVMEEYSLDALVPVGTAIENARHTSLQTRHDFTYDGTHLIAGRGQYIAACTLLETLFKPAFGIEIEGNMATYIVPQSQLGDYYEEGEVDVTSDNRELCQRCAVAATENPYEVTRLESAPSRPIPRVDIATENGAMPTCTRIDHPEGCWGKGITDNDYVKGRMTITEGDATIFDSGEPTEEENGKLATGMRLRIRGNTSAYDGYPSYKVKLAQKDNPMGMGECRSKSWNLMRPWGSGWREPSLFRNLVGQTIGRLVGMEWQPDYRYCELYINGKYRGLYWFSDAVERNDHRVDLKKSGFLAEADAYFWQEDDAYWFRSANQLSALGYTFKYPEPEDFDADDSRLANIESFFNSAEQEIYSGGRIEDYLDVESFAKWMLAHDILGISDAEGSNMYFYKRSLDSDSPQADKMKLGPLWDFDWVSGVNPDTWSPHHRVNYAYGKELFKYEAFVEAYLQLADDVLDLVEPWLASALDSVKTTFGANLEEALKNTHAKKNSGNLTVDDNIEAVKDWFAKRVAWMKGNVASLRSGIVYPESVRGLTSLVAPDSAEETFDIEGRKLARAGTSPDRQLLPRGIFLVRKDGLVRKIVR